MTLSDLERRDARGYFLQGDLLNNARIERLNSAGIGEGHISRGHQGQPNFGGSVLFMHTPFDAELPNLTW